MEDSEIKPGDIVRLLQPFRPKRHGFQEYAFAIVAGVVRDGSNRSKNYQSISDSEHTAEGYQSGWDGLVVYLYDPASSRIYVDQFGVKALFSFDFDEVVLYKAIQTPVSK
jgi:hypothetical protein